MMYGFSLYLADCLTVGAGWLFYGIPSGSPILFRSVVLKRGGWSMELSVLRFPSIVFRRRDYVV